MHKNNLAVGVFDSGMGGLTVLRALRRELPDESFIYLGDTARLPYGTKSPNTVQQYALQMANILASRHIKALVIACNTATTAALPRLQQVFTHIPVLGVVKPGASAAVTATMNQQIAVLATETTIASRAYHDLILEALPQATISARACSLLVALAEEGMVNHLIAEETLKYYLEFLQEEDTLLLGCTHFPVFRTLLQNILPNSIKIVDSADATAKALAFLLTEQQLLRPPSLISPSVTYCVTDSISRFQRVGEIFLGESLDQTQIELVDGIPTTITN